MLGSREGRPIGPRSREGIAQTNRWVAWCVSVLAIAWSAGCRPGDDDDASDDDVDDDTGDAPAVFDFEDDGQSRGAGWDIGADEYAVRLQ